MKLTKSQQKIVNSIKENGRFWTSDRYSSQFYRSCDALVKRGILTVQKDGIGHWFDLAGK